MGDRISIQFEKNRDLSGVLFSHWDGLSLKERAEAYINVLVTKSILKFQEKGKHSRTYPLDRLEPETVMVSFISEIIGQGDRIESNYYIPDTADNGDNSDSSHHIIDIKKIEDTLWDAYNIGVEKKGQQILKEIED